MERKLEMDFENVPYRLLHEAIEEACEKQPKLVLMPYEQMKAAASILSHKVARLAHTLARTKVVFGEAMPLIFNGIPSLSHSGPCGPQSCCDGSCSDVSRAGEIVSRVRCLLDEIDRLVKTDGPKEWNTPTSGQSHK